MLGYLRNLARVLRVGCVTGLLQLAYKLLRFIGRIEHFFRTIVALQQRHPIIEAVLVGIVGTEFRCLLFVLRSSFSVSVERLLGGEGEGISVHHKGGSAQLDGVPASSHKG